MEDNGFIKTLNTYFYVEDRSQEELDNEDMYNLYYTKD